MKKLIFYLFISGFLLLSVGCSIMLNKSYVPEISSFQCDLDTLDKLCTDETELPLAINTLTTAKGELLKWTIAAGDNSIPNQYIQTSFQIVYKDRTIILDAPMDEGQFIKFKNINNKQFLESNYKNLQEALKQSSVIIFTHEHPDHIGGLANSPCLSDIYQKAIFTEEQYNSPKTKKANFPPIYFKKITPVIFENYYKVSPGIVLIKASGHTQGHLMVYVYLQDGTKYLFAGDIAWNYQNITKLKNRPLLATLLGGEKRKQIGHQIRWLYDNVYKNDSFDINIVLSHDPDLINAYIKSGLLGGAFEIK